MDMDIDIDPSPEHQRTSRKHLRSSSDDDCDWSSNTSGQFDDAEEGQGDEYRSPTTNPPKRRRSNDWPLPDEAADYGTHDRRAHRTENGNLCVGGNGSAYRASPRASPRGSLASLRARHAATSTSSPRRPRGRTSRFVEATMNDSVSERPPSIYLQENKQSGNPNRSSGIFRFGKAIASAFNPFGVWTRNSESSSNKSPQKDAITQAEKAYAELKKAGYKGTNKGHYTEHRRVSPALADQTWQSIQHKMPPGSPVKYSYRNSVERDDHAFPARSDSSASKRSSLQDLRLPKSLFHRGHESPTVQTAVYCDRFSEESEPNGIRKQPSRRELSRQVKLMKKVSNLEDKLERARRELRDLTGNEERAPAPAPQSQMLNTEMDPASFPRKFVPGALPTLPSERLLDQQAAENRAPGSHALPSMEDRESFSFEESRPAESPAAARSLKRRSSSMGKDRYSRKRKSPIPERIDSRNPLQPATADGIADDKQVSQHEELNDSARLSPPDHKTEEDARSASATRNTKRSPSDKPRKASSTTRSPNSKPTTPLRKKPSSSNLRSMSSPAAASDIDILSDIWATPLPAPQSDPRRDTFYQHPQRQINPDRSPRTPTRSKTSPTRRRSTRRLDEDIPPVPPLPLEHRSSAAKINVSVNRSPKKRPVSAPPFSPPLLSPSPSSAVDSIISGLEDYEWPEDVF
ncbi:hypothetical protein N7535_003697 [Penicillium sp. DV-2018c]|nr:hypothetical protein N7535_003697 [Penicillium sp. DV-2018c]